MWSLSPLFQRAWTLIIAACGDMQLTFNHLADVFPPKKAININIIYQYIRAFSVMLYKLQEHYKNVRHVKNHVREYLTIIWISLLHTWRSYSLLTYILFSAQRTPWWVLTRNTIAKPPVERKPTAWKSLNTGQLSYRELACTEKANRSHLWFNKCNSTTRNTGNLCPGK